MASEIRSEKNCIIFLYFLKNILKGFNCIIEGLNSIKKIYIFKNRPSISLFNSIVKSFSFKGFKNLKPSKTEIER